MVDYGILREGSSRALLREIFWEVNGVEVDFRERGESWRGLGWI